VGAGIVVAGIGEEAARGRGHDRVHGRMGKGGDPARLLGVRWRVWLMALAGGRAGVWLGVVGVYGGWWSRELYGEAKATPGRHDTDLHQAGMGMAPPALPPAGRCWRRDATWDGGRWEEAGKGRKTRWPRVVRGLVVGAVAYGVARAAIFKASSCVFFLALLLVRSGRWSRTAAASTSDADE
jgi:hypothetical protein